jgi:hypothetical protein
MTAGVSRKAPVGAEKFVWDPDQRKLSSVWTNESSLQWAIHPVSSTSNTVHLCGLERGGYSLIAIDWDSGKQVGKTTLGTSPLFNTMGGAFIPMSNGDLYVTGVFGPIRVSKAR